MVRHLHLSLRAFLDELPVTLAVVDVALGAVLMFGGAQRVSGPGFSAAKTVAPMATWGALLAFIATCALYHLWRHEHAGVWVVLCAMWLGFFAATIIRSAIVSHSVGLIGIVLLCGWLVVHLQVARKAG